MIQPRASSIPPGTPTLHHAVERRWYSPFVAVWQRRASLVTAFHAPAAEIESMAGLVLPARAVYTTHMRNEGDAVLDSLEESFAAGRAAGVPVMISHHKTVARENLGRTADTLPVIAAAIAWQEAGLDAYPYIASSTVLSAAQAARALKVLVTWSKSSPQHAGCELSAIAADWGIDEPEAVERLLSAGVVDRTMRAALSPKKIH